MLPKSKEKKKVRWKPEKNEEYYLVNESGEVCYSYYNDKTHKFNYTIGNCFKTQEEAEEHRKKLIYQQQYRDYALVHNDEIDWNNQETKSMCYYDYKDKEIKIDQNRRWMFQGAIYFTNKQDILDFIKLIGEEDFKKYILEVEE